MGNVDRELMFEVVGFVGTRRRMTSSQKEKFYKLMEEFGYLNKFVCGGCLGQMKMLTR